jgi:hypothetical protein
MELLVGGAVIRAQSFITLLNNIVLFRYNWTILLPAELSAASVLISFWDKTINPAVWVTILMAVVISINLLGAGQSDGGLRHQEMEIKANKSVGAYGEAEFVFA